MDLVAVYEQALTHTGKLIAGVKPDQLSGSTPCAEFDVKALINHIVGGCYLNAELAAGNTVDLSKPTPDFVGNDGPTGAFEQAQKTVLSAVSDPASLDRVWHFPFGDLGGTQGVGVGLTEAVVHGWDLAKATGQDTTIDPGLATAILEGAKQGIPDAMRNPQGNPFKPPIQLPDSASPGDKLIAFLGRKP